MKENRGTTVLLTVIGVATLLVAVVGATFAYFTAGVSGNDSNVKDIVVNSATVGQITFAHGNVIDLCDETDESLSCTEGSIVYPGAQEDKTFTVTADAKSTTPVEYEVYMVISKNTFATEYLKYKVSATSVTGTKPADATTSAAAVASTLTPVAVDYTSMNGDAYKPVVVDENTTTPVEVKIGSGTLGTYGTVDTWNLDVWFENASEPQGDQGAKFEATIVVRPVTAYTSNDTSDGFVTTSVTTTVAP